MNVIINDTNATKDADNKVTICFVDLLKNYLGGQTKTIYIL